MMARPWQVAAYATLVAWAVLMLAVRRTDAITDDWQGWRQADTAQIARNLVAHLRSENAGADGQDAAALSLLAKHAGGLDAGGGS